jgi:hypothetical protein
MQQQAVQAVAAAVQQRQRQARTCRLLVLRQLPGEHQAHGHTVEAITVKLAHILQQQQQQQQQCSALLSEDQQQQQQDE